MSFWGKYKKSKNDKWLTVVFIVCMCLAIWSIEIYRNTFINWKILAAYIFIGCIVITFFFWKKILTLCTSVWLSFFIFYSSLGAFLHFGFLFFNQQFADNAISKEIFKIEDTGRMASGRSGCGKPYAVINFHGLEKDMIFSCDDIGIIKQYDRIEVTYSPGLFGYEVIQQKKLLK